MRYVFGPTTDVVNVGPPSPPPKADPTPEYLGQVDGVASFRIPPYDLDGYNRLDEIRVYLIPSGSPGFADAAELVASALPFAVANVAEQRAGASVAIPLPDVPPGVYVGQTVYGYES